MQKIVQSGKLSSGFWLTIVTLLCNNLSEKFGSKKEKKNETNIIDKFSNSSKPYLVLLPDTEWKNMGPIGKYSEHYTSRIFPKEHHLSTSRHSYSKNTLLRYIKKNIPERTDLVFEHGHNLCRLIKTLQHGKKVINFAFAAEDRKMKENI